MNKNLAKAGIKRLPNLYVHDLRKLNWYTKLGNDPQMDQTKAEEFRQYASLYKDMVACVWEGIETVNKCVKRYSREELKELHIELNKKAERPTFKALTTCPECSAVGCIYAYTLERKSKYDGGLGKCPRLRKWIEKNNACNIAENMI